MKHLAEESRSLQSFGYGSLCSPDFPGTVHISYRHIRSSSSILKDGQKFRNKSKIALFGFLSFAMFLFSFSLLLSFPVCASADLDQSNYFTLKVDLPPEVVNDVSVADVLPQGLIYVPASLSISGAATNPTQTIAGLDDGSQPIKITWSFGTVDNTADKNIIILFRAIVADYASNRDGAVLLPAQARLSWKDAGGSIHAYNGESGYIKVIEPDLEIVKTYQPSTSIKGDKIDCTLSISHTSNSHADAFDVDLTESLPKELAYVPGSQEILSGPIGTKDDSNQGSLKWHFDIVDRSWNEVKTIKLRYKAIIAKSTGNTLNSTASLAWSSLLGSDPNARHYAKTAVGTVTTAFKPPDLKISIADYPDPVRPGGQLTYTVTYVNKRGDASGVAVDLTLDDRLDFVSANPSPDRGTANRWTLGDLAEGGSGVIKVNLLMNDSTSQVTIVESSARISCNENSTDQDSASTTVKASGAILSIEKTASSDVIRPGDSLSYTLTYKNNGNHDASNVTITDIVDKNLQFDSNSANPQPTKFWTGQDGTHLWWNSTTIDARSLGPSSGGTIEFSVSLPSDPGRSTLDSVYNRYKIDSNEIAGSYNTLETFILHSLWINKTSDKQAYSPGEVVNYTITYGNDEQKPVDFNNAVIEDDLPDLNYTEYLSASPQPTSINGNVLQWNIGKLGHGQSGTIQLYVKIRENCSEMRYKSSGSVSGEGFINIRQNLDTAQNPDHLTNYVKIYDKILGELHSASVTIKLLAALGTAVNIRGHGSGTYQREEQTQLIEKNRSIQVKTSLSESYHPTTIALPLGRSIRYSSKYSEAQTGKNRITGATLSEVYMYANRIKRDSTINLDKNGSTLYSETSFEGVGHVDVVKKDCDSPKAAPFYESHEDYLGSFNVTTYVDEYGKNVVTNRSVIGTGLAASDKRITNSQRSYESGTGAYQVGDKVETQTNYIAKDLNASYAPVSYSYTPDFQANLSKKWEEGMWSKSGKLNPTVISEQFSGADYLKVNMIAKGLNEMDTKAEFSGKAEFKVVKDSNSNSSNELNLYDLYIGKYKISRKTTITGVAKYDEPHLTISKVGNVEPAGGRYVSYKITVINDGNQALEPVYVLDLFPPGTEFVSSSLRPIELATNYSRWTLTNLGIGSVSRIDLKLKMKEGIGSLVNQVQANGGYNNTWVTAENFSALRKGCLSCSLTQLLAAKEAYVDQKDPMLVHYRIFLKNRLNDTMAASVTDQLPGEMEFVNSTVVPAYYEPDKIIWNIIEVKPGENVTIDYLARALHRGTFVNQAHIDASYLHGEDSVSTDVTASVDIGTGPYSRSISGWQPPSCFGLKCTDQGFGDEWIPCESCGESEPEPIGSSPSLDSRCPSCDLPTETDVP